MRKDILNPTIPAHTKTEFPPLISHQITRGAGFAFPQAETTVSPSREPHQHHRDASSGKNNCYTLSTDKLYTLAGGDYGSLLHMRRIRIARNFANVETKERLSIVNKASMQKLYAVIWGCFEFYRIYISLYYCFCARLSREYTIRACVLIKLQRYNFLDFLGQENQCATVGVKLNVEAWSQLMRSDKNVCRLSIARGKSKLLMPDKPRARCVYMSVAWI